MSYFGANGDESLDGVQFGLGLDASRIDNGDDDGDDDGDMMTDPDYEEGGSGDGGDEEDEYIGDDGDDEDYFIGMPGDEDPIVEDDDEDGDMMTDPDYEDDDDPVEEGPGGGGDDEDEYIGDGGDEEIVCPTDYDPVCGEDGQTYGNACEADREGVAIAYEGECAVEDDDEDGDMMTDPDYEDDGAEILPTDPNEDPFMPEPVHPGYPDDPEHPDAPEPEPKRENRWMLYGGLAVAAGVGVFLLSQ